MKVILFDLDDTLFDYSGSERNGAIEFFNHFQSKLDIELSNFLDLWKTYAKKHNQRWINKEITFQQQRQERIREFFGKDLNDKEASDFFQIYLNYFKNNWKCFDDYSSVIELKNNYDLGIITDGPTEHQFDKLKSLGIINDFAIVVTSELSGHTKPNQKTFKYTLDKLKIKPSDALYIGDNYEKDYLGAKSSGMFSLHLNRKENDFRNDYSINSLNQIKIKIRELKFLK